MEERMAEGRSHMHDTVALLLDDDLPPARLGELLREARKRRGLKRRAAALRAGVSRDALKAYEQGVRPVPPEVCARLAECYGEDLTAHVPLRVPVEVAERWIAMGDETVATGGTGTGLLRGYVDLLVRMRRAKPGEPVPLRAGDLAVLANALGGEPAQVEQQIARLLGCSREEAARLRSELLRRKVILPVAGLAAGVALLAAVSAGAHDGEPGSPAEPTLSPASSRANPTSVPPPPTEPPATVASSGLEPTPEPVEPGEAYPGPAIAWDALDPEPPPPPPAPAAPPPAAPAADGLTDATVPPDQPPPTPDPDDPPVSIPPGEEFIEIGDAITEP